MSVYSKIQTCIGNSATVVLVSSLFALLPQEVRSESSNQDDDHAIQCKLISRKRSGKTITHDWVLRLDGKLPNFVFAVTRKGRAVYAPTPQSVFIEKKSSKGKWVSVDESLVMGSYEDAKDKLDLGTNRSVDLTVRIHSDKFDSGAKYRFRIDGLLSSNGKETRHTVYIGIKTDVDQKRPEDAKQEPKDSGSGRREKNPRDSTTDKLK